MISRLLRPLGGLVLAVAVLAVLAAAATQIPGALGRVASDVLAAANPFHDDAVDRTGPPVLKSLTALSEFKAASGYYEVVVDLEAPNDLPDVLSGDRIIYVGKGEVEAVVDFSELDERRITAADDKTSVSVQLPAPRVGDPRLNLKTSYVAVRDEGFITKFKGTESERKAQLEAIERLSAVASGEGDLVELAQESTTAMLRGLFGSLGYTDITITFDESPASSR